MECPICAALYCEHSRECETEAVATIQQRAQELPATADRTPQDTLSNVILESRKRQAHLAQQIHGHREAAHPEPTGPKGSLRKGVSA